jgi:intracellular multiplication protein IcmP
MAAPKGGGQGQGNSTDGALTPLFIVIVIVGALYYAWIKGHTYIVTFLFAIKKGEIHLLSLFLDAPVLQSWLNYMNAMDPSGIDWSHVVGVSKAVGYYMRYPFALILAGMAFVIFTKNVGMKFRRTHSMQTLREQEQKNWVQIMPVIGKKLTEEDIKVGPWAMALTPMEFARQHNLLKKDEFNAQSTSNMEVPLVATIKKGEAKRIFTLQLGQYWNGFDALNPHTKALAAIFMAKINRDRDGAAQLLKALSESSVKGHLDVSQVPGLLKKHSDSMLVQELLPRHAYINTMMASLLETARDDGVLASADFLWLKPIDRRLWYILNTIGRQTAFVEVGGIFAHWKVEKALKRKSLIPMVDEAVRALESAMKEVKLTQKEWDILS